MGCEKRLPEMVAFFVGEIEPGNLRGLQGIVVCPNPPIFLPAPTTSAFCAGQ